MDGLTDETESIVPDADENKSDSNGYSKIHNYIIGELRFFFARRRLNGCLGRLDHVCRVLLGWGNHLHNPDLVGTKGIMVL